MSLGPPAAKETIQCTGRDGYVCADATRRAAGNAAAPAARCRSCLRWGSFMSSPLRREISLRLDVGCPDHLGPHLDLGRDAGGKLPRRARDPVVAERGEPLLRVRLREDFYALAVKNCDDFRGSAGGDKNAHPTIAFDLWVASLRHGRHVGENLRALLAGDRKRPHGSFPDVLHGRLWRTEADRRVTSNNCGDRGPAAPEGNMDEVEAKRQPELFAGKMRLGAGPR